MPLKCIFLGYKLKKNVFAPPAANLFVGEKMNLKRGGGGYDQNAQYIPLTRDELDMIRQQIFKITCGYVYLLISLGEAAKKFFS